jgi:hypothetical protein
METSNPLFLFKKEERGFRSDEFLRRLICLEQK